MIFKNIKIIFFYICSFILIWGCSRKPVYYLTYTSNTYLDEISKYDLEIAKKILIKNCREDKNREKYWDGTLSEPRDQYQVYEVDSMEIVPISLFELNNNFKYNLNFYRNLLWKRGKILGFYTLKNGKFEGLLDWSYFVHHNLRLPTECFYFTTYNSLVIEYNDLSQGYKFLDEHNHDTRFLFGVKYFVNTLWFIENNQVYVLDLKDMRIYNPDEFIKAKCYDGFIRDIARGGQFNCNH